MHKIELRLLGREDLHRLGVCHRDRELRRHGGDAPCNAGPASL